MSDQTSDAPGLQRMSSHVHRAPKREFYAYFAIIFLATLPLCVLTWLLSAGRQMRIPERDPVSSAWSQARIITPMIFSA